MNIVWDAFWFFLPAGIANVAPVFANKIPILNRWQTPLDLGKTYKGQRILGDNKTWRGLVFGTLMAGITYPFVLLAVYGLNPEPDKMVVTAFIGGLIGLGALTGDAVESFFKRRRGIRPGNSWFPFDQTDYIIGGLLLVYPLVQPPFKFMTVIFMLYFSLHLVGSYIGFLVGLKEKPI
jgi:CDP-2,3-bis-(O-geranylgeranyl)-sn-glycerol synthase